MKLEERTQLEGEDHKARLRFRDETRKPYPAFGDLKNPPYICRVHQYNRTL